MRDWTNCLHTQRSEWIRCESSLCWIIIFLNPFFDLSDKKFRKDSDELIWPMFRTCLTIKTQVILLITKKDNVLTQVFRELVLCCYYDLLCTLTFPKREAYLLLIHKFKNSWRRRSVLHEVTKRQEYSLGYILIINFLLNVQFLWYHQVQLWHWYLQIIEYFNTMKYSFIVKCTISV